MKKKTKLQEVNKELEDLTQKFEDFKVNKKHQTLEETIATLQDQVSKLGASNNSLQQNLIITKKKLPFWKR